MIRQIGGDHRQGSHAASTGGDGSIAKFDVGIIRLKKQRHRIIGERNRLRFRNGGDLRLLRKSLNRDSDLGGSRDGLRDGLLCAGTQQGGGQQQGQHGNHGFLDFSHGQWLLSLGNL